MTDWAILGAGLAIIVYLSWAHAVLKRWWRRTWGQCKAAIVWSPITVPLWLWRRLCLLWVPGWLSEKDFYQTVEWRKAAATNKRNYGNRCIVCTVSNAELPSGTALHSHHVRKRLRAPWLALRQSNLAPVCPTCHRDVEAGRIKLRWDGKRWGVA